MNLRHLLALGLAAGLLLGVAAAPNVPGQAQVATPTITPIPLPLPPASPSANQDSGLGTLSAAAGAADGRVVIETPTAGTQVGSPMVITGYTSSMPELGTLSWFLRTSQGAQLGTGSFAVGSDLRFNATLAFVEPNRRSDLLLELLDVAGGQVLGSAALRLNFVPAAEIGQNQVSQGGRLVVIDTPAPGTRIGSPVVITGRTNIVPYGGQLTWRLYDPAGTIYGSGTFNVFSASGGGSRFNVTLYFREPRTSTDLIFEVLDIDPEGDVMASAAVGLNFVPPPARPRPLPAPPQYHPPASGGSAPPERSDYPFAGTARLLNLAAGQVVGSPQKIIGAMNRLPAGQVLYWRVRDRNNVDLGNGQFVVYPTAELPAAFEFDMRFERPTIGGQIILELFEISDAREVRVAAAMRLWPAGR